MIRNIKLGERVVSIKSEGHVSKLLEHNMIKVNWEGIGELDMPSRLFRWDAKFNLWEIKNGREYV